jgi:hypothetical protein
VPHQRGDEFDKKQELRDYIDPFESLGTKLTFGAKFEDKNAYFAIWQTAGRYSKVLSLATPSFLGYSLKPI